MNARNSHDVHTLRDDFGWPESDNVDMAAPNHLRAWRKFRRLTQQQLADAIEPPTSKSVIASIESGARGLSDKWLRRLAPALGTTPGFLLDHDPADLPNEFLDAVEQIAPENRAQALAVLKTFARTGTTG